MFNVIFIQMWYNNNYLCKLYVYIYWAKMCVKLGNEIRNVIYKQALKSGEGLFNLEVELCAYKFESYILSSWSKLACLVCRIFEWLLFGARWYICCWNPLYLVQSTQRPFNMTQWMQHWLNVTLCMLSFNQKILHMQNHLITNLK